MTSSPECRNGIPGLTGASLFNVIPKATSKVPARTRRSSSCQRQTWFGRLGKAGALRGCFRAEDGSPLVDGSNVRLVAWSFQPRSSEQGRFELVTLHGSSRSRRKPVGLRDRCRLYLE